MSSALDLHRRIDAFARDLQDETSVAATVDVVTETLIDNIDGAHAVAVTLWWRRKPDVETLGATDPLVERADQLQRELGEGPCLDALHHKDRVHSPDLRVEERWSRWAPTVVQELGVHSMLCVQLFVTDRVVGSLNLYGTRPHAFTPSNLAEVGFYAGQAAVAVAAVQEVEQLRRGMVTRNTIGQAQGILMERYGIDGERAFALLTRISQHENRKLAVIAADLVASRVTPGAGGEPS